MASTYTTVCNPFVVTQSGAAYEECTKFLKQKADTVENFDHFRAKISCLVTPFTLSWRNFGCCVHRFERLLLNECEKQLFSEAESIDPQPRANMHVLLKTHRSGSIVQAVHEGFGNCFLVKGCCQWPSLRQNGQLHQALESFIQQHTTS